MRRWWQPRTHKQLHHQWRLKGEGRVEEAGGRPAEEQNKEGGVEGGEAERVRQRGEGEV